MTEKRSLGRFWKEVFVTQTKGFTDVSEKIGFWQTFAGQNGGALTFRQTVSKDLTSLSLTLPTENGLLEFTESDTHPFKIAMTLVSDQRIKFNITHQDLFDRLIHFIGFRGIVFSHPEFRKKYIVRGHDKKAIQQILGGDEIIPLILKTNIFLVSCDYNKGTDALQIRGTAGRSVNTIHDMTDIFNLFKTIAKQINTNQLLLNPS